MKHKLEFRSWFEMVDGAYEMGGVVSQEQPQLGGTNADWTKSQAGGSKAPIRSKNIATMKKKMRKK